ncbi:MAG TPA: hypothetical protein VN442_23630 [Bryobacteraceae bacterium]|nr:hypothetical protein [Bryobacteraceae bacterium]
MARLFAIVLWAAVALAGEPGASASIVGGTVAGLESGQGRIELTRPDAMVFEGKKSGALSIPYERIHTLEYGQRVSRRYAESILISPVLLLAKSRKHFITVGFTDGEGHRQALVFRVAKGDVRAMLAGLEAKTGRRVEYQDEEARKAGGG